MVCAEMVDGGKLSVMMEALSVRSGNGGETTSVTGTKITGSPVTVTVTVDV